MWITHNWSKLLSELVDHLRQQAGSISDASHRTGHARPGAVVLLLSTWPYLQTAFFLLARHSALLESELALLANAS